MKDAQVKSMLFVWRKVECLSDICLQEVLDSGGCQQVIRAARFDPRKAPAQTETENTASVTGRVKGSSKIQETARSICGIESLNDTSAWFTCPLLWTGSDLLGIQN